MNTYNIKVSAEIALSPLTANITLHIEAKSVYEALVEAGGILDVLVVDAWSYKIESINPAL